MCKSVTSVDCNCDVGVTTKDKIEVFVRVILGNNRCGIFISWVPNCVLFKNCCIEWVLS